MITLTFAYFYREDSFRESSSKLPAITSEDEIICAATALTSLSLSPICSTTSSPQNIKGTVSFKHLP